MSGQRIDRPYFPKDFAKLVSRVRKLEWHDHDPETDQRLTVFDEDISLGETTELEFLGSAVSAIRREGGRIQVTVSGGGGEFDAIVDGTAITDTTQSPPIFAGIGEALSYLWVTLALNHANVLVRPGNYVETANWQAPVNVILYGSSGWNASTATEWQVGAFQLVTHGNSIEFLNMTVTAGSTAKTNLFGTNVTAYQTYFALNTIPASNTLCSGTLSITDCYMQGFCKLAGSEVNINGLIHTTPGATVTLPVLFVARQVRSIGGLGTLTVPAAGTCVAEFDYPSGNTAFVMNDTTATKLLRVRGAQNCAATISGADIGGYDLEDMGNVTVSGPARSGSIRGKVGTLDITGPCELDVSVIRSNASPLTLRGATIKGSVSARPAGSSGTFLDFIGATDCEISIAADGALASGTKKSYAFDAASLRNTVLWGIGSRATFSVAGTDAGTGNRVLPEGTSPFTTDGHVIEDEGTPLAQQPNLNFVGAGVTVTDSAPDTIVTIPGSSGDTLIAWVGL